MCAMESSGYLLQQWVSAATILHLCCTAQQPRAPSLRKAGTDGAQHGRRRQRAAVLVGVDDDLQTIVKGLGQ